MKIRHLVLAVSFAAASACLSGCGDPPQPVDAPGSTSKGTLPPGHVPIDGKSKPVAPAGEETRVAGTVLLEGAGFDQPTGTLFLNIRLKGMKAPWLSRKYVLANLPVVETESGAKRLAFELRSNDPAQATFNLNGQHVVPPGQDFEVYACYKSGPNVEDKTLADAVAPFQAGKSDYELTVKLPLSAAREAPVEPWYQEAFRSDYRRVYAHRDLASAREEAKSLVAGGLSGRVLDLCCGFGRHTLALRELGIDVTGLDLSMELLREARTLENAALLEQRLLRADATALPFLRASFDGVINLFSSFGYFGELGDARMLSEIARVLRPGGRAVLDLMNPGYVRAHLRSESSREGQDFLVRETRALADGGKRVTKEVELRLAEGGIRRWREDVRLYEESEMRSLLAGRGLVVETAHGDFDGRPFTAESQRMLLTARR